MKIQTSIQLAGLAAVFLGSVAAAHAQVAVSDDLAPGLVGQKYTGIEYDYTHRTTGASRAVHHYAFVSNLPLPELHSIDGAFRYDYSRESAEGLVFHQHEVAMAFTGYMPQGDAKLFFEGDAGWAWRRTGGGGSQSGLVWRGVFGAEIPVMPRVMWTPYISYKEAAKLDSNAWRFGAKIARRFDHDWSGNLGLAFDDNRNAIWSAALQRRF
jgi:hypothetical protein